jgi:hypothetical protein
VNDPHPPAPGSPPGSAIACRNCGAAAGPRFCGSCGQELDDHRSPLLPLLAEVVAEAASIDGRAARTAAALARPGRLTREYLDGRRASYLSPVKLYLTASLVLFSSLLALDVPDVRGIDLYVGSTLVTAGPASDGRMDLRISARSPLLGRVLDERFSANLARLRATDPQVIADRLFTGLRALLPAALFVFLPLLALALKLLHLPQRPRPLYVDCLIFGAHFQSALFVALALTWAIARGFGASLFASLIVYTLVTLAMLGVYLPLALARVFRQSRAQAMVRSALLVVAYAALLNPMLGFAVLFVIARI